MKWKLYKQYLHVEIKSMQDKNVRNGSARAAPPTRHTDLQMSDLVGEGGTGLRVVSQRIVALDRLTRVKRSCILGAMSVP